MTAQFFFDLACGEEVIRDDEGVEAADLECALAEARSIIAEMAEDLGATDINSPWTLIVRDEIGLQLAHVPIGLFSSSKRV